MMARCKLARPYPAASPAGENAQANLALTVGLDGGPVKPGLTFRRLLCTLFLPPVWLSREARRSPPGIVQAEIDGRGSAAIYANFYFGSMRS
jgi:hypothetical protein